ncbi:hypothetical protein [Labrys monachus]|uniref:Pimeloyl-ACP methyl ester carboxylesterase n=1 Tax=Labrys monachus TaxID=217067 RepID=A0ABU0FNF3_9HYPH|nr:hypothetical protein [Labrys monachus]MDQ0395897.1 pimeloyl-ACP methyl ester carboxylesterase [Labrys monachus]
MVAMARSSDTLLVSCAGIVPKDSILYAMENTSRQIETNKIFICDSNSLWYYRGIPGLTSSFSDTVDLVSRLVRRIDARRTFAVGTSGGGYMALALAALLGLDRALAMSPQTSLDAGWRADHGDGRWQDSMDVIQAGPAPHDIRALIASAGQTRFHVVYPRGDALDAAHAERLGASPKVRLYPLETSEHNVSEVMQQRGVLQPCLEAFLQGGDEEVASDLRSVLGL